MMDPYQIAARQAIRITRAILGELETALESGDQYRGKGSDQAAIARVLGLLSPESGRFSPEQLDSLAQATITRASQKRGAPAPAEPQPAPVEPQPKVAPAPSSVEIVEPELEELPAGAGRPRLSSAEYFRVTNEVLNAATHLSFSQMSTIEECPAKWAFSRHPEVSTDFPEVPAWWNLGGQVVHHAMELYAPEALASAGLGVSGADELLRGYDYHNQLQTFAEEASRTSGFPVAEFRSAKRGKEGRDWWEATLPDLIEQGAKLVRWYASKGYRLVGVELKIEAPLASASGREKSRLPLLGFADMVLSDAEGRIDIVDWKTGASQPASFAQPALYAEGLMPSVTRTDIGPPVLGTFAMLRTGKLRTAQLNPQRCLMARHRFLAAEAAMQICAPRPGGHCWTCRFKEICPDQ